MRELLRVLPLDYDKPIQLVCYHPVAERHLILGDDKELAQPTCLAVEYEYDSVLHELCAALGWQGGVLSHAIAEVKRLKQYEKDHR